MVVQEKVSDDDRVLAEHIDAYVKDVVGPRVRRCWKRLDGAGQIEFRYTFLKDHDSGVTAPTVVEDTDLPVTIVESSLTPVQSARALECMLDAVDGTSFPTGVKTLDPMIFKYQVWTVGPPPG